MANRNSSGGVGLEYGKIKLYSAQDDMDKLYEKLELIMTKWGYPESGSTPDSVSESEFDLDPEEVDSEDESESVDEEPVKKEETTVSPWDRLRFARNGGEDSGSK